MRDKNKELHRQKISKSLIGKFGESSRRWLGDNAGYVAKHMWISKHFKKPNNCEMCGNSNVSRIEWSNISGKHFRKRNDYLALCPSCHRKTDLYKLKPTCPNGHPYSGKNLIFNIRGHRTCRMCRNESMRRYRESKRN